MYGTWYIQQYNQPHDQKYKSLTEGVTAMEFMEVSTKSIHTQVTDAIREAIVSGKFAFGEKLSETILAQKFGVSRTPIREALKQLQQEGLVEIIPRVGTCVTKPTVKEVSELFDVKEVLEGLAANLFAKRGNTQELEMLEECYLKMKVAAEKIDIERYTELNEEFHDCILKGSDSSKLQFHYNLLINQLHYKRFVLLTLMQPNRLPISLKEHENIVNAIKTGDGQKAEKAMRDHVLGSGSKLTESLAKEFYNH